MSYVVLSTAEIALAAIGVAVATVLTCWMIQRIVAFFKKRAASKAYQSAVLTEEEKRKQDHRRFLEIASEISACNSKAPAL